MVWQALTDGLIEAMRVTGLDTPERRGRIELAVPRDPTHGDWTTNVALGLAKELGRPPRRIAESLAAAFPHDPALFDRMDVAGPGFLNVRYSAAFLAGLPARVLQEGERFGRSSVGGNRRVNVEYVSANPTGPLNVVNARAAAVGATLVRLLDATGHESAGEFYVNDTGRQVDLLGASVRARMLEARGVVVDFPEEGYQGQYVRDLAASMPPELADDPDRLRDRAIQQMLDWQKRDLADYGTEFGVWFRESNLHPSAVAETLVTLKQRGVVYESEGAQWLRTSDFGDDKDRVIVRGNGIPTYLLPDIAYHRDKHRRGFATAIDLWGPDHHGHILPMRAALQALGLPADFLEVLIVQQVNLLSGGQPVKMSKRAGEFITLRDLMDDVGADCAKFFFLMRSTSAHLDFDLDLAKRQNDENPAYYVQYAHARIASVLRFAAERDLVPARVALPILDQPEEIALIRKLAVFPELVRGSAMSREPHRVPSFLMELAAEFHRFYHACRVVSDDLDRSRARLALAAAARVVLANGLGLMGVTAPERMDRAAEVAA